MKNTLPANMFSDNRCLPAAKPGRFDWWTSYHPSEKQEPGFPCTELFYAPPVLKTYQQDKRQRFLSTTDILHPHQLSCPTGVSPQGLHTNLSAKTPVERKAP